MPEIENRLATMMNEACKARLLELMTESLYVGGMADVCTSTSPRQEISIPDILEATRELEERRPLGATTLVCSAEFKDKLGREFPEQKGMALRELSGMSVQMLDEWLPVETYPGTYQCRGCGLQLRVGQVKMGIKLCRSCRQRGQGVQMTHAYAIRVPHVPIRPREGIELFPKPEVRLSIRPHLRMTLGALMGLT